MSEVTFSDHLWINDDELAVEINATVSSDRHEYPNGRLGPVFHYCDDITAKDDQGRTIPISDDQWEYLADRAVEQMEIDRQDYLDMRAEALMEDAALNALLEQ